MKKFVEKLKQHLEDSSWRWRSRETYGGCETCGYGGDEVETINGDALWVAIDAFCETFNKDEK